MEGESEDPSFRSKLPPITLVTLVKIVASLSLVFPSIIRVQMEFLLGINILYNLMIVEKITFVQVNT